MNEISKINFDKNLPSGVSIVDFYSYNCVGCKAIENTLDMLSSKYDGSVEFYKCNVENDLELARKFRITGLPTIILFKNAKPIKNVAGTFSIDKIENILNEIL